MNQPQNKVAKNTPPAPAAAGPDVAKVARVVLHVGDLERGVGFYTELLGAPGRAVGGGRAYFDCGPVILAILDPARGGLAPRPQPDNLYFTVRDVQAVHGRARSLHCLDPNEVHGEPAGEVVERPWGERSFYALDPWGNGLCFVEEASFFSGDRPRQGG